MIDSPFYDEKDQRKYDRLTERLSLTKANRANTFKQYYLDLPDEDESHIIYDLCKDFFDTIELDELDFSYINERSIPRLDGVLNEEHLMSLKTYVEANLEEKINDYIKNSAYGDE